MMYKVFRCMLMAMVLSLLMPQLHASELVTVKLKDGSTLKGRITVQRPGVDLSLATEKASFVLDEAHILSLKYRNVKYEDLSRIWKRWALTEKSLLGNSDGRYLVMYDISTKARKLENVVKVEHALAPKVTYDNVEPTIYKVPWGDIATIQRESERKNNSPCLEDEILTTDGDVYRGFVVSQQPGRLLSIKTKNGIKVLDVGSIRETRKVTDNISMKINEIAGYTNTLVLKGGQTKTGLITIQHYGEKTKEQFVVLIHDDGTHEKVFASDVEEYHTTYKEDMSEKYLQGNVYVNEFRIKKAVTDNEDDSIFYTDKKVFPFPEGITITFKSVGAKFQEPWTLISLNDMTMRNGIQTQGYTPKMRETNSIKPSSTDLTGNVSSISFVYLSPGFYALVNANSSETYIIKIVK